MEAESQQENQATDLQGSLRDRSGLSIMPDPTQEARDRQLDLNTTPDLMLEARGHLPDHRTGLKPDLKDLPGDLQASLSLSLDQAMLSRCFQLPT